MNDLIKQGLHETLGYLEEAKKVFNYDLSASEIVFLEDSIKKSIDNLDFLLKKI